MNEKKLEALKKSNIAEIKKAVKNLDEDSSQDTKIRRKSKVGADIDKVKDVSSLAEKALKDAESMWKSLLNQKDSEIEELTARVKALEKTIQSKDNEIASLKKDVSKQSLKSAAIDNKASDTNGGQFITKSRPNKLTRNSRSGTLNAQKNEHSGSDLDKSFESSTSEKKGDVSKRVSRLGVQAMPLLGQVPQAFTLSDPNNSSSFDNDFDTVVRLESVKLSRSDGTNRRLSLSAIPGRK